MNAEVAQPRRRIFDGRKAKYWRYRAPRPAPPRIDPLTIQPKDMDEVIRDLSRAVGICERAGLTRLSMRIDTITKWLASAPSDTPAKE